MSRTETARRDTRAKATTFQPSIEVAFVVATYEKGQFVTHPNPLPVDPSDLEAWRAWADGMLAPMDLSVRLLHDAAEAGQRKWDATSPLAPKITSGTDRWSEMVVALRAGTRWRPDEHGGLPRTVHPSGRFYVVVRTGAGSVGRFDGFDVPTPKNPLGAILCRIIDGLASTTPMFDLDGQPVDADAYREPTLWLFLTSYHDGMIYSELSQPSSRKGDQVTAYSQRIPLPPLPFTEASLEDPGEDFGEDPDETGPDIDIQPLL